MKEKEDKLFQWINTALSKISLLEGEKGVKILEKCGRVCAISLGLPKIAKKIREEANDKNDISNLLDKFVERALDDSIQMYKEGELIIFENSKCGCPIVGSGIIDNSFFCNCSIGYIKEIFEGLFDKLVEVDLHKSILKGDNTCRYAIKLVNDTERWLRTALNEIGKLGEENRLKVLENCGKECARSHELADGAKEIRNEVIDKEDIDLLFDTYKKKKYGNSPRLYKEGEVIYLEYHACGCPVVNNGVVSDPIFCNCTRGYTKERFETLFDKPVRVELLKSILNGDKICKQAITIVKEY